MGYAAEPSSTAKVILLVTDSSMPLGTATSNAESSGKFRLCTAREEAAGYEAACA